MYTNYSLHKKTLLDKEERGRKLQLELSYRLELLPIMLQDEITYTEVQTVRGALFGDTGNYAARVGKVGEFSSIFPEYRDRTLASLLWELNDLSEANRRGAFGDAVRAANKLSTSVQERNLTMLAPVGDEDSKWKMKGSQLAIYRETLEKIRKSLTAQ